MSAGTYNLVVITKPRQQSKLRKWLDSVRCCFEEWRCENGTGSMVRNSRPPIDEKVWGNWLREVGRVGRMSLPPQLQHPIREYQLLMVEAMSRFQQFIPAIEAALRVLNEAIVRLCSEEEIAWKDAIAKKQPYDEFSHLLTHLINLNFGVGQLTNQAGIVNVMGPACNQVGHTLLGTGTANVALYRIYAFIHGNLGLARVDKRFGNLDTVDTQPNWDCSDKFWTTDHLKAIPLTPIQRDTPVFCQMLYLNEPEHFRATLATLSAPTSIVDCCNSHAWSLLTMSHEMSHALIRAALTVIRPGSKGGLQDWVDNHPYPPRTKTLEPESLLESVRTRFLSAAIRIDKHHESLYHRDDKGPPPVDAEQLQRILTRRSNEIEEVMVHTFDFLYFYQQRETKYISSIWRSWSVLPHLNERIPDYVVRTLCAVLAGRIGDPQAQQLTYKIVEHELSQLQDGGNGHLPYVDDALAYLRGNWDKGLRTALLYFTPIVQIVRGLIYSEELASSLASDPHAIAGTNTTGGYPHKPLGFDESPIANPLHWLEFYTRNEHPSSATALWMLQTLAFNVIYEAEKT